MALALLKELFEDDQPNSGGVVGEAAPSFIIAKLKNW